MMKIACKQTKRNKVRNACTPLNLSLNQRYTRENKIFKIKVLSHNIDTTIKYFLNHYKIQISFLKMINQIKYVGRIALLDQILIAAEKLINLMCLRLISRKLVIYSFWKMINQNQHVGLIVLPQNDTGIDCR